MEQASNWSSSTTGISSQFSKQGTTTYWEEFVYGRDVHAVHKITTIANTEPTSFYKKFGESGGAIGNFFEQLTTR